MLEIILIEYYQIKIGLTINEATSHEYFYILLLK